jgi:2',3'-cyclic-nucleotide 2'-phosphodiesterase (5'-nucleotidase family)
LNGYLLDKSAINNSLQTIGTAAERFPNEEAGKGDRLSRKQETALGDLVADSMYYWKDKIDFAFVNGGTITGALVKGPITNGAVKKIRYYDQMSILTMTGAQVKTLFYDYIAKVPHSGCGKGTGAFGQVSEHVRYTIDYNNDPRGGVISGLTLEGEPFVDDTSDIFVTSTRLLNDNTDGYVPILDQGTSRYDSNLIIAQAVAEWIYDQPPVPIEPKLDGRIVLKTRFGNRR